MSDHERLPIALIGSMGAGKTAIARALGERLGASVADLDAMIEAVEGCSVAEVFARAGESGFRRREGELLARVLHDGVHVIACGGGIVVDPGCRRLLRTACETVWLRVTPAEAARRLAAAGGEPARVRPLLAGGEPAARLAALLAERAPFYAEVAHRGVDTDGLTVAEIVERILVVRDQRS